MFYYTTTFTPLRLFERRSFLCGYVSIYIYTHYYVVLNKYLQKWRHPGNLNTCGDNDEIVNEDTVDLSAVFA